MHYTVLAFNTFVFQVISCSLESRVQDWEGMRHSWSWDGKGQDAWDKRWLNTSFQPRKGNLEKKHLERGVIRCWRQVLSILILPGSRNHDQWATRIGCCLGQWKWHKMVTVIIISSIYWVFAVGQHLHIYVFSAPQQRYEAHFITPVLWMRKPKLREIKELVQAIVSKWSRWTLKPRPCVLANYELGAPSSGGPGFQFWLW